MQSASNLTSNYFCASWNTCLIPCPTTLNNECSLRCRSSVQQFEMMIMKYLSNTPLLLWLAPKYARGTTYKWFNGLWEEIRPTSTPESNFTWLAPEDPPVNLSWTHSPSAPVRSLKSSHVLCIPLTDHCTAQSQLCYPAYCVALFRINYQNVGSWKHMGTLHCFIICVSKCCYNRGVTQLKRQKSMEFWRS